jgi:hypothetical protein
LRRWEADHFILAKRVTNMTALDLRGDHLLVITRCFGLNGYQSNVVDVDTEARPFADRIFDSVYFSGGKHNAHYKERSSAELRRDSSPSQRVIVSVFRCDRIYLGSGPLLIKCVLCIWLFRFGCRLTFELSETPSATILSPNSDCRSGARSARYLDTSSCNDCNWLIAGCLPKIRSMYSRPTRMFLEIGIRPFG